MCNPAAPHPRRLLCLPGTSCSGEAAGLHVRATSSGRATTRCAAAERLDHAPQPSTSAGKALPSRRTKQYDVVALSNLCVDIMVPVEELPPPDAASRKQLLRQLTAQPPPVEQWEVGGVSALLCLLYPPPGASHALPADISPGCGWTGGRVLPKHCTETCILLISPPLPTCRTPTS